MRTWMLRVGVILLVGTLFRALSGCGHDPNHDIEMKNARAAADRIHKRPSPGEKRVPGHGG